MRDELGLIEFRIFCFVTVDTVLNLSTELSDKALNGPSGGVSKCADSMALDLK